MSEQILTLIFDDASKDDIIDLLMGLKRISGFTQTDVNGYSREHAQYDIAEQVAGYRQLFRIDVLHQANELAQILQALKSLQTASDIKYWVTPVLASGQL